MKFAIEGFAFVFKICQEKDFETSRSSLTPEKVIPLYLCHGFITGPLTFSSILPQKIISDNSLPSTIS